MPHATLSEAIASLQSFGGTDLTQTLAKIGASLQRVTIDGCAAVLTACGANASIRPLVNSVPSLRLRVHM